MIQTDQIFRATRAVMDLAGLIEKEMRKAEGKRKSKFKDIFFRLVRIRAIMIDLEDSLKRKRNPEEWK